MDNDFNIGKLPPQAIDFEEAVLGAMLIEQESIIYVSNILKPESFYKDEHQKIYQAIINLFTNGKAIDILTVPEELRKNNILDEVGGVAYITRLTANIASSTHIEYHAKIIAQKFIQRELIRISTEIQKLSYDNSNDVSEIIDYTTKNIYSLLSDNTKNEGEFIGEIAGRRIKKIEELSKLDIKYTGIPSGFTKLDRITGGWQSSDLIILAGRPSMGKTFIGMSLSEFPSELDKTILFYSLEMSKEQLFDRLLSKKTGIENGSFKTGNIKDYEWDTIEKGVGIIEKMKLIIDDTPALTINELRAKTLKYNIKYGIDMIIIDYLQLMRSPGVKNNREREVSEISSALKSIAKELNIPVIALAQLNRSVEIRSGDKRPILSDLRDSGSIEQDADLVLFVHRPEKYGILEDENGVSLQNKVELIVAKHRNGAVGIVDLWKNNNWTELRDTEQNINIDEIIDYTESNSDIDNIKSDEF